MVKFGGPWQYYINKTHSNVLFEKFKRTCPNFRAAALYYIQVWGIFIGKFLSGFSRALGKASLFYTASILPRQIIQTSV